MMQNYLVLYIDGEKQEFEQFIASESITLKIR